MKRKSTKTEFCPLFLTHQIFVTKEQRYALYQGERIHVIGSFIETTNINNAKDFFPKEIFVKYQIDSEVAEDHVVPMADGYKIHMPVNFLYSESDLENIDLESSVLIEDILDNDDGGKEEIFFKWRRIIKTEKNKKFLVAHSVSIRDIEVLESSISFSRSLSE